VKDGDKSTTSRCKVAISTGTGKPNTVPTQSGPFGPANQTRALVLSGLAWGWLTGLACHSTEIKQAQEAGRRPAKQTMRHVMFVSLPFHSLAIPVDRNGEQNSKGIPSQRLSAAARQPDRIKQTKKKKRVVQT